MPNRNSLLLPVILLVLLAVIAGCDNRSVIVISNFSEKPTIVRTKSTSIVGLALTTKGAISGPLELQIGLAGKVYHSIHLPASGNYQGRFDWYDSEVELSFAQSPTVSGELTLRYKFQTL